MFHNDAVEGESFSVLFFNMLQLISREKLLHNVVAGCCCRVDMNGKIMLR